jgi:hypothetical protein
MSTSGRMTAASWRAFGEEQARIGRTIAAFCRKRPLPVSSFHDHPRKLREAGEGPGFVGIGSAAGRGCAWCWRRSVARSRWSRGLMGGACGRGWRRCDEPGDLGSPADPRGPRRLRHAAIEEMQHQMEDLLRPLHGRKSEKLDPNQLLLEELILAADGEGQRPEQPDAPEAAEEIPAPRLRKLIGVARGDRCGCRIRGGPPQLAISWQRDRRGNPLPSSSARRAAPGRIGSTLGRTWKTSSTGSRHIRPTSSRSCCHASGSKRTPRRACHAHLLGATNPATPVAEAAAVCS